jgi:hypothetical protein
LRDLAVGDSVVLVCAVLAALTSGVLVAYGLCLGVFRMFFRMQAKPVVVKAEVGVSGASVVEG